MNVIVIPDGAMIVVPLIEKNGHTYLSPTNFSKYDNELNLNPDFKVNMPSETPSGVRGRISLLAPLLDKADAAIVLGRRPAYYRPMYNVLNELILFCGNGCNNAHSMAINIVSDLDIPVLKLAYPTTRDEIIGLIDKVNLFLKDFDSSGGDDLNCDLKSENEKIPLNEFKKILNNPI
jgi:putative methanogenesis marker protein 5